MANLGSMAMLAELDGAVLVDKPANLSAHDAVKAVKSHFNLVKVGHGGTLAPNDTGLLLVLIGNATRFSSDLMGRDRAYCAVARLGRETDTCDREGKSLAEKPTDGISREMVQKALDGLRGDVYQKSPAMRVVKMPMHAGYDIMPTDEEDMKERMVHIYRAAVTDFTPPLVSIDVSCTKGASVRSLIRDMGAALGCGASVESLRRVRCASCAIADAIPLMELLKLDAIGFRDRVVSMGKVVAR